MNKVHLFITVSVVLFVMFSCCIESNDSGEVTHPKDTIIGAAYSPANLPNPSDKDVRDFFEKVKMIGNHVILIVDWGDMPSIQDIGTVQSLTKDNDLEFHLQLSPTALYGGRQDPSIPSSVDGDSFGDETVREAFKAQALELASLRPNYLGLGTEANFLVQNPDEFEAYVSLTQETYNAVKAQYPSQDITISFQWDILLTQEQFDVLPLFNDSVDIFSFTTYPNFFEDSDDIPENYYSCIRDLLPTERIGFSEVGWSSHGSSEQEQANYYERLPALMGEIGLEYITLALLHDVSGFTGDLNSLNYVGIRNQDGTAKESWDVVVDMEEMD